MSLQQMGTDYPGARSQPRVFRSPFLSRLGSAFILIAILTAASVIFLPNSFPTTVNRATRAGITLTVIIVASLVVVGVVFWWNNRRIVVTDDRVEVWRLGQRLQGWDRATTGFGTEVTVHRSNGVRTSTSRTLVVGTPQGQVKVVVPGISRDSFNELVAILNPVGLVHPAQSAAAIPAPATGRVFTPNRAPLARAMRKLWWASLIVLLVSLAIGFGGDLVISDEDAQILLLAVAGMGVVVAFCLGMAGLAARKRYQMIPSSMQAGPGWVRIDDMTYPFTTLSSVQVSPATYESKRIVLKPISGKSFSWQLNGLARKGEWVFDEWPAFVGEVVSAASGTPGLVRLDLE